MGSLLGEDVRTDFVEMFTDGVRWDDERLANFQDTALKG